MKHFPLVAFLVLSVICAYSLYNNFVLLDKYVALKDKYAVALSYVAQRCP